MYSALYIPSDSNKALQIAVMCSPVIAMSMARVGAEMIPRPPGLDTSRATPLEIILYMKVFSLLS